MLVVKKPIGIPINKQFKKWLSSKNAPSNIANPVPRVNNGPKERKMAISPSPLLATNLNGLAV